MKLFILCFITILFSGTVFSQDGNENIQTKTFYNKWKVTYSSDVFFEYNRPAGDTLKADGMTILFFPKTMIDDGIFASLGLLFSQKKRPEHILELSFPVGIGNRSYGDLAENDMNVRVILISGRDTILRSVSYESMVDQVTVGGREFTGRLYRFTLDNEDFNKLKTLTPDKLLIHFKNRPGTTKPKKQPPGGHIESQNAMIGKFSSLAKQMDLVKISEVN